MVEQEVICRKHLIACLALGRLNIWELLLLLLLGAPERQPPVSFLLTLSQPVAHSLTREKEDCRNSDLMITDRDGGRGPGSMDEPEVWQLCRYQRSRPCWCPQLGSSVAWIFRNVCSWKDEPLFPWVLISHLFWAERGCGNLRPKYAHTTPLSGNGAWPPCARKLGCWLLDFSLSLANLPLSPVSINFSDNSHLLQFRRVNLLFESVDEQFLGPEFRKTVGRSPTIEIFCWDHYRPQRLTD